MKPHTPFYARAATLAALLALAGPFAATNAARAQDQTEVKVKVQTKPGVAGEGTPTSLPEPTNETNKGVAFSELGAGIAAAPITMLAGATKVRQLSAPLGQDGQLLVLNVYRMNGEVFMDALTAKGAQAWTRRNHIRLKTPLPLRPEQMTVTMRSLDPKHQRGYLVVLSDDGGNLALTFPKGFGGSVGQMLFPASVGNPPVHRTYTFGGLDGRGFAIVRAVVDSTGQVKPETDIKYWVWNGTKFIPRAAN